MNPGLGWREHFGRDAADVVAIATTFGGFDLQTVLLRCFARSRRSERIAMPTVEAVLQALLEESRAAEAAAASVIVLPR